MLNSHNEDFEQISLSSTDSEPVTSELDLCWILGGVLERNGVSVADKELSKATQRVHFFMKHTKTDPFDRRASILEHHAASGMQFDKSPEAIRKLQRQVMGKPRLKELDGIFKKIAKGKATTSDVYRYFTSGEEANLAFSYQASATLENHTWLAKQLSRYAIELDSVAELRCANGLLISWLAQQYPEIRFQGFDMIESMLSIARASICEGNVEFHRWNYCEKYAQDLQRSGCLISTFGIDFDTQRKEAHDSTDSQRLRESQRYLDLKHEAALYFRAWRGAVRDGGLLFATLRIPGYSHFIAVCDAAAEHGWAFMPQESTKLETELETIPALTFRARENEAIDVDALLSSWSKGVALPQKPLEYPLLHEDGAAIRLYRQLENVIVREISSHTFPGDGHTMVTTVGSTPELAFSFSMATTSYARLKLLPLEELDDLEVEF